MERNDLSKKYSNVSMQQFIYKLKLLLLSGVVFFFLLLPTFPGLALSVGDVPNPRRNYGGWVTDMAGVLSDPTEHQLNRTISQFEDRTTIEIAVVTVKTTKPSASPKAFTTKLFNTWGIGKARHNNGLLFLIATEDRRVEIETGSGLESLLPSSTLHTLLASEITPKLSQGDFDGGTLAGTQALIETLSHEIAASPLGGNKSAVVGFSQLLWRMLLTAGMAIGFTAICIFLYSQYQNYRDRQIDRHLRRFVGPATVMERGWAVMLDFMLLAIVYTIAAFLTSEPYKAPLVLANETISRPIAIALILGNIEGACNVGFLTGGSGFGAAVLVYRTVAEAILKCTFGQLAAGVRVVKADNSLLGITRQRLNKLKFTQEKSIGLYAALVRNLMLGIDGFFLYLVGIVAIRRSDKWQRLGDRLARTVVICRHIDTPYSPSLNSPFKAGGSFGTASINVDFGGGSSDGGGAGSNF